MTTTTTRKHAGIFNGGLGLSNVDFNTSSHFSIIRADDTDPFFEVNPHYVSLMEGTNIDRLLLQLHFEHIPPSPPPMQHTHSMEMKMEETMVEIINWLDALLLSQS